MEINFDAFSRFVAIKALLKNSVEFFIRRVFDSGAFSKIGELAGHCKRNAAKLFRLPTVKCLKVFDSFTFSSHLKCLAQLAELK